MKIRNTEVVILFGAVVFSFSGCSNLIGDTEQYASPQRIEVQEAVNRNQNEDRHDDLKVSLLLVDSKIVLNQPILINIQVENNGPLPIRLDFGANFKENLLFTIVYPDGTRTNLPRYSLPAMSGLHIIGNASVEPQKTYTRTFILNEWVDLNKPGSYTIEAKLNTPITIADGSSLQLPPFKVDFKLEPVDETYLKKLCETYINRLENTNYSEASEIGVAISYFSSPVAVPCIKRALASKRLAPYNMINALRDRPRPEGVDALIGFVKEEPGSDSAEYAKIALEFIKNTTKDQKLRQRIKSARF